MLFYICDLPVAEIATELGISEGTVKSSLIRARSALAVVLRDVSEEVAHSDAG